MEKTPTGEPSMNRRDMLKAAAIALAAGVYVGGSSPEAPSGNTGKGKKVIVVGAGMGGLATADFLQSAGYTVQVFEARKRPGGRVLTDRTLIAGKTVERGGELIGKNHRAWQNFAQRFGLSFIPAAEEGSDERSLVMDGICLGADETRHALEQLQVIKDVLASESEVIKHPSAPWLDEEAVTLDGMSLEQRVQTIGGIEQRIRDLFCAYMGTYNGAPANKQSLLAFYAMLAGGGHQKFWTETDTDRCKGGSDQLTNALVAAVGGNDNVRYASPVTGVSVEDRGVTVHMETGDRHKADRVILAVPPSVLGQMQISPNPRFPSVQMGSTIKHLIATENDVGSGDSMQSNGMVTWKTTTGQPGPVDALALFYLDDTPVARALMAATQQRRHALATTLLSPAFKHLAIRQDAVVRWLDENYSRGSYGIPACKQYTRTGNYWQESLEGRVDYVGEHLSPDFVGYMEGALQSGLRTGRRIVEHDR